MRTTIADQTLKICFITAVGYGSTMTGRTVRCEQALSIRHNEEVEKLCALFGCNVIKVSEILINVGVESGSLLQGALQLKRLFSDD